VRDHTFEVPIQVRWRDLDAYGHVNHAAVVSYLEIARVELWRSWFGDQGLQGAGLVVVGLSVDYRRQIALYDEVRVSVGVAEARRATFAFDYRVSSGDLLAASALTRHACLRADNGRPTRIPADLRRLLQQHVSAF
jgi:acyl-CoA thioester hydrolase